MDAAAASKNSHTSQSPQEDNSNEHPFPSAQENTFLITSLPQTPITEDELQTTLSELNEVLKDQTADWQLRVNVCSFLMCGDILVL